jgi:putative inorganic carbon (HCO3(-)) transporter
MGTFGFLTFLWVFAALFAKLKNGYSVDKTGSIIMMVLLFSYLIACFSDNVLDYLVFQWYFWFIMGVVCAWYRLALTTQLVPRGSAGADRWTMRSARP